MDFTRDQIEQAIHRAQHCQRNWDLDQKIPDADMELLKIAVTQCPSKQNAAYYKVTFVTNRELIRQIYDLTDCFTYSYEPKLTTKNPQTLANLLVAFSEVELAESGSDNFPRNDETKEYFETNMNASQQTVQLIERDRNMATGVAAGFLNLTASLLGYATGCCAAFDGDKAAQLLRLDKPPRLLMGIGFRDENIGRRIHHEDHNFLFSTRLKQPIELEMIE